MNYQIKPYSEKFMDTQQGKNPLLKVKNESQKRRSIVSQKGINILGLSHTHERPPRNRKCACCYEKRLCRLYKTNLTPERYNTSLCWICSRAILEDQEVHEDFLCLNDHNFLAYDVTLTTECDPLDIANLSHFESKRRKH